MGELLEVLEDKAAVRVGLGPASGGELAGHLDYPDSMLEENPGGAETLVNTVREAVSRAGAEPDEGRLAELLEEARAYRAILLGEAVER